jgi:hypothetical protein
MIEEYYNQFKPFLRLVLQLLFYAIVVIIIMAILYQDKIQQYLDENWNAIRCEPYVIPFAGFSNVADGKTYGEKVNKNFQHCTGTHIKTAFPSLLEPFIAFLAIIKSSLEQVSGSINTFRKALSTLRIMFAALVKNTVEKMANSYAASVFLQEKMKNIVKRQTAVVEVMRQFLVAFPFVMESLMYGPIPRFAVWLSRYTWMLLSSIVICILCTFGGPFVSMFACPMCAICFTPSSIVGRDGYRKPIKVCDLGSYLDPYTEVTGIIYFGQTCVATNSFDIVRNIQLLYPLHEKGNGIPEYGEPETFFNPRDAFDRELTSKKQIKNHTWVTSSHAIFDSNTNQWTRISDWARQRGIRPAFAYEPVICLITSNNTIPVNQHMCKDYEEINNTKILHTLAYQRECVRNEIEVSEDELVKYASAREKEGRMLYTGMTYEQFVKWVEEYDSEYKFPQKPSLQVIRHYFYQYEPDGSKLKNRYENQYFRKQLRGFRIDRGDITWYRYRGHILAENTLVKIENGKWKRVFMCHDAVRLDPFYQTFTLEPNWVIHVYTDNGDLCLSKNTNMSLTLSDAMEVKDDKWNKGELDILTRVSNIELVTHESDKDE